MVIKKMYVCVLHILRSKSIFSALIFLFLLEVKIEHKSQNINLIVISITWKKV